MNRKTKIMLAEHDSLFSNSLAALLQTNADFEVSGQAHTEKDLLEKLKETNPAIVLFGDERPIAERATVFNTLKSLFPAVKIITLENKPGKDPASELVSCRLSHSCKLKTLFDTIRAVASGIEIPGE